MPKSLNTPISAWTAVFRAIVAKLDADVAFRDVVSDFRHWFGIDGDKHPMVPRVGSPVVRLTPNPGGVDWYDPSSQIGVLNVLVEMTISSSCVDDVIDLWDVIVSALAPADNAFCQALIALGAETGEITFHDPAITYNPENTPEGYFYGRGGFRLRVQRSVNP